MNEEDLIQPPRVNVASGSRPLQETIQQLIKFGLTVLQKDVESPDGYIIKELFSFTPNVAKEMSDWLIKHKNIPVVLNWPTESLGIPQIAIVTENEREKQDATFLGDYTGILGTGFYSQGTTNNGLETLKVGTGPVIQREQKGYAQTITLNVFVRANDPLITYRLTEIVRLLLFMNKNNLIKDADLHNMTLDSADVNHNPDLFPEFAYTRVITIRGDSFFDYNLPVTVVRALDFSLYVADAIVSDVKVDLPTPVKVPYTE